MDADREARLRRTIDALGTGDIDAAREAVDDLLEPDAEWHSALATRVHHGREGVVEWLGLLTEGFADYRTELDHVEESGDVVISFHRFHGIFQASGVVIERKIAIVWKFRGDRVVRTRSYVGWEEGRAAFQNEASPAGFEPTT